MYYFCIIHVVVLFCIIHVLLSQRKKVETSWKQQFGNVYSYLREMWKTNSLINIFILC